METITPQRKTAILLWNSEKRDLLLAGIVSGAIGGGVIWLLLILFLPPIPFRYGLATAVLLFIVTVCTGFVLRYELTLMRKYRLTTGIPLFYTLIFLVGVLIFSFLLAKIPQLTQWASVLVVPIIALVFVSLGYAFCIKKLFLALLKRISHLDFISLHYRDSIMEHLRPLRDRARRYGDSCTVVLLQIQGRARSSNTVETDEVEQLEQIDRLIRSHLRLVDRCGIRSRDIFWILLPNTDPEVADIPLKRLSQRLEEEGLKVEGTASTDLRNSAVPLEDLLLYLEKQLLAARQ